jgi:hypothetical protein
LHCIGKFKGEFIAAAGGSLNGSYSRNLAYFRKFTMVGALWIEALGLSQFDMNP